MHRRFHFIAEHHVDNIHLILNFERFMDNLVNKKPGAAEQLEHLKASEAKLDKHFRWLYETVLEMKCPQHEGAENEVFQMNL